ncbi:aspartate aminotransferase family protein [Oceanospirillaceae bacterium]|nr:aspartate aminotransferase family protein [Oceanospirillaceae bacterium]MDB9957931.1 aspartate aminotransferase family protein [Oceanospirillaceae bacterium]
MTNTPVTRALFDEVMVPNYAPAPVIPVRGKGSRIWDQSDNEYIDFAGGIAVTSVGHSHPKLVATLKEQGEKLWHISNVMTNEPALRLAKKLTDATFAQKVYFANSGAEANEAAFKLARRFAVDHFGEEKNEIIAFEQGFHGRTLFTVSVGGQPKYSQGFGPAIEGITHLPYNDIKALEAAVSNKTCAIIMEPLQGEGGIIDADPAFIKRARELCDQHNALLVLDEVQTGAGRLGTLYGYQQTDVIPDILTTAKGLGNGFPVAAMLTTDKVATSLAIGTHGSTYGGNPLACSIAEAVIDIVNTPEVLAGVNAKSKRFKAGLEAINMRLPFCNEVRGKGLLLGCALNSEYQGRAGEFLKAAQAKGLLVLVAGPNVIRMAPSLLIPEADIDAGLAILEAAISDIINAT